MLKNTFFVTLFLLLSSVLGFLNQILFVTSFGASNEMDIYFKVTSVPSVISGISPAIFTSVLIPALAQFQSDPLKRTMFQNTWWQIIVIAALGFSFLGLSIFINQIDIYFPGIYDYERNLIVYLSVFIWISCGLNIISSYLSAILYYQERFVLVASTSLFPSLFMISSILMFRDELGVLSIALGYSLSFLVQFIIFRRASKVSFIGLKHTQSFRFAVNLGRQTVLVFLSLLPFSILVPIAYNFASTLEIGSVSYLGYSQSFAGFLSVATSMGVSIVSFPELANKFAGDDDDLYLQRFEQKLRYVLLFATFFAGLLIALRTPLISLFYQRGAFNESSVGKLARVLPWYLIASIFISGLNLLRNYFFASGKISYIARLGILIPIFFSILAYNLKERYAVEGLGISYAISISMFFILLLRKAKINNRNFLNTKFGLFLIINTTSVFSAAFIMSKLISSLNIYCSPSLEILTGGLVFLFLYFLISHVFFRLKESNEIILLLRKALKVRFNLCKDS